MLIYDHFRNSFVKSMNKMTEGKRRIGMAVPVPANVKSSPAYLRKKYMDTMAMVSEIGNPDLFITFTGNRMWPEIEVILYLYISSKNNISFVENYYFTGAITLPVAFYSIVRSNNRHNQTFYDTIRVFTIKLP